MNRIHPAKLAQSKWTAVTPHDRDKHFVVVAVTPDAEQSGTRHVTLEAVLSRRRTVVDWRALEDSDIWQPGWQ